MKRKITNQSEILFDLSIWVGPCQQLVKIWSMEKNALEIAVLLTIEKCQFDGYFSAELIASIGSCHLSRPGGINTTSRQSTKPLLDKTSPQAYGCS